MRKRVFADNRFRALHHQTAHAAYQAGGLHDLPGVHVGMDSAKEIAAGSNRHDDLLQRCVSGAFADAVDRPFDLPRSRANRCQGVGHGQAEVVVAVDADEGVVDVLDGVLQVANQLPILLGNGEADRVRDVQGGRAGLNDRAQEADHEVGVRPRGVHW